MKYISKYRLFETEVAQKPVEENKGKERSGRLLTDEQENSKDGENAQANAENVAPSIMFTDVVGSSKLWSDDAQTMSLQLNKHFELMNSIAKQYNGFVVKTIGDAFMIYFEESNDTLERSIECGINILRSESLPLRVGICEGSMQEKTYVLQNAKLKDYFGNVVNVASRMESKVAEPEGIAFSSMSDIPKSILDKYNPLELTGKQIPDLKGASIKSVYKIKL